MRRYSTCARDIGIAPTLKGWSLLIMSRSSHFVFTINNWTHADLNTIRGAIHDPIITYLCYQQEIGEEEGTPHLQGYVQCVDRPRFTQVNRILGGRASLQESRGTNVQCRDYCCKEDTAVANTFEEFGEMRRMGKRKRQEVSFADIVTDIEKGMDIRTVIKTYPEQYIKYHAGIDKVYHMFTRKRLSIYYGPWLWEIPREFKWRRSLIVKGNINIGKTTWVKSLFLNPLFVTHIDDLKTFDVNFHGGIIFDDMNFSHIPREAAIHLVDVDNPRSIHVRYGRAEIPANVKKVFTTNLPEIFPLDETGAIARRCYWMTVE